jgi:hypothetical protein
LVAGRNEGPLPGHFNYLVGKYNTQGGLEFLRTHSSALAANFPAGEMLTDTFRFIRELPDGKIIAAGDRVARFLSDGTLDPTFTRNRALADSTGYDQGFGALLPDGKIAMAATYRSSDGTLGVIQLLGRNGATIGQIRQSAPSRFAAVLAQPDGKIVVVGETSMRRYLTISALAGKQSDFEGDLTTNVGVFRPSTGEWAIRIFPETNYGSTNETFFGQAGDQATPGRYRFNLGGEFFTTLMATTGIAVYRPDSHIWYSTGPNGEVIQTDGFAGDAPVNGDFDGDGLDDFAGFQNGIWHVRRTSDGAQTTDKWGMAGDIPVTGDYDYDGFSDLAIFRPSTGTWYVRRSSDGTMSAQQFGLGTDQPLPGDYDGDGRTDEAVFRPSNGTWYVLSSRDNSSYAVQFGQANDRPAPGDYDGDGLTDLAVFRAGEWYILQSATNSVSSIQFGLAGDVPLSPGFAAQ